MIQVNIYDHNDKPTSQQRKDIVRFLHTHLDEYGDKPEDIAKAFDYAMKKSKGGFIVTTSNDGTLTAAAVVNRTGMEGYIPENILVYIATHNAYRGNGLGSVIMNTIIQHSNGNIALHVEPDNPALNLYRKFGFTNKYLEMRLDKQNMPAQSENIAPKKEELNGTYHS